MGKVPISEKVVCGNSGDKTVGSVTFIWASMELGRLTGTSMCKPEHQGWVVSRNSEAFSHKTKPFARGRTDQRMWFKLEFLWEKCGIVLR